MIIETYPSLDDVKKEHILQALAANKGNMAKTQKDLKENKMTPRQLTTNRRIGPKAFKVAADKVIKELLKEQEIENGDVPQDSNSLFT